MASSGGQRAAGTDGKDFKFRQRVDNHYKIMAEARKQLKRASRVQLACALGLSGLAGTAIVVPTETNSLTIGLAAATAAASGLTGKNGLHAAGAQQPEKLLRSYSTHCKVQIAMVLSVVSLAAYEASSNSSTIGLMVIISILAAIGLVGALLGMNSAQSLVVAFAEQAKKKSESGR